MGRLVSGNAVVVLTGNRPRLEARGTQAVSRPLPTYPDSSYYTHGMTSLTGLGVGVGVGVRLVAYGFIT